MIPVQFPDILTLHHIAKKVIRIKAGLRILCFDLLGKSLILLLDGLDKSPLRRMAAGLDSLITDPANLTLRMSLLCRCFLN